MAAWTGCESTLPPSDTKRSIASSSSDRAAKWSVILDVISDSQRREDPLPAWPDRCCDGEHDEDHHRSA